MKLDPDWLEFAADFRARFPTEASWLKTRAETRKLWWSEVFSKLSLSDSLEVSRLVMLGTIAKWYAYEDIPAVYRRECGKLRSAREDQKFEERQRQTNRVALADRLQGLEARPETRFKCLACRDTGFATIWRPETIQAAMKEVPDIKWETMAIRCNCDAAQRKASKQDYQLGDRDWHIPAIYDDAKAKAAMYSPTGK